MVAVRHHLHRPPMERLAMIISEGRRPLPGSSRLRCWRVWTRPRTRMREPGPLSPAPVNSLTDRVLDATGLPSRGIETSPREGPRGRANRQPSGMVTVSRLLDQRQTMLSLLGRTVLTAPG